MYMYLCDCAEGIQLQLAKSVYSLGSKTSKKGMKQMHREITYWNYSSIDPTSGIALFETPTILYGTHMQCRLHTNYSNLHTF